MVSLSLRVHFWINVCRAAGKKHVEKRQGYSLVTAITKARVRSLSPYSAFTLITMFSRGLQLPSARMQHLSQIRDNVERLRSRDIFVYMSRDTSVLSSITFLKKSTELSRTFSRDRIFNQYYKKKNRKKHNKCVFYKNKNCRNFYIEIYI